MTINNISGAKELLDNISSITEQIKQINKLAKLASEDLLFASLSFTVETNEPVKEVKLNENEILTRMSSTYEFEQLNGYFDSLLGNKYKKSLCENVKSFTYHISENTILMVLKPILIELQNKRMKIIEQLQKEFSITITIQSQKHERQKTN